MKIRLFIQATIIFIPILLFGWLLWQDLVPTGRLVINYDVGDLSPFVNRLLPGERALSPMKLPDGHWAQQVIDEPTYFTVEPPRHFDFVELELVWANDSVPIIEVGGVASEDGTQILLEPLQNLIIDQSDWYRIESGQTILLQRNEQFTSIEQFLDEVPDRDQIATYHYDLEQPYILKNYWPSSSQQTIDVSLRGLHQLKTYIKDETLNFEIAYQDMNREDGSDPITVIVTDWLGREVIRKTMNDDNNIYGNSNASGLHQIELAISNLVEGVYKIELRAGSDIFFRSITTTQQKIVFLNNVYLGDEVGYQAEDRPVSFWTEAQNLTFTTHHADGAQEADVNGEIVLIPEPYERYGYSVGNDTRQGVNSEIKSPQGDLIVYSDGHIAFDPNQYFNPDPVRLAWNTNLDKLGINYIIAKYTSPSSNLKGWVAKTVEFDNAWLYKDNGAWKFVLSTPGISDLQEELWISEINVAFVREPLTWSKLIQEIKERLW
ncbi:MAG: hypothetical protein ABIH67_04150 [Candidatus Uhrbacteria bacterium]